MDHDDASTHPINNSTKHNAKSRWSNNNQQPLLFVARLAVVQSLSGKIRAKKVMKPFVFRAVFLLRHCCMYFDRLTCRKQRLMRCDYDSHKDNIHWSEQKSVLKFIKRIWEDRFSLVSFFLFTDWSIGTESAAKTVFFLSVLAIWHSSLTGFWLNFVFEWMCACRDILLHKVIHSSITCSTVCDDESIDVSFSFVFVVVFFLFKFKYFLFVSCGATVITALAHCTRRWMKTSNERFYLHFRVDLQYWYDFSRGFIQSVYTTYHLNEIVPFQMELLIRFSISTFCLALCEAKTVFVLWKEKFLEPRRDSFENRVFFYHVWPPFCVVCETWPGYRALPSLIKHNNDKRPKYSTEINQAMLDV